jgi:ubiquinone/menaquinone biosynthesis C-methylase UbiE
VDEGAEAKAKAARTYNAAADSYDHPVNTFWERYGRRTIERLGLEEGARVLDACCGSGASALPAAEVVGERGAVLGIDLAENLLERARAKARARGFGNVEFRRLDMLDPSLPEGGFDAVVCVFGIFFVPDMEGALRSLLRLVRPGGQLAITTWGPRFFEPVNTAFWESVRRVSPSAYKGFHPWDRISDVAALCALLTSAGVKAPYVQAEAGSQPLAAPEDWWPMVLGTGYRGTIEALPGPAREEIREDCLAFIEAEGVTRVEANVMYAAARKPR